MKHSFFPPILFLCLLCTGTAYTQGNFVWAKSMGGNGSFSDFAFDVAVDGSGNVYTTGTFMDIADFDPGPAVYNLTGHGNVDIFVCKQDNSGNLLWAKGVGSIDDDQAFSLDVDAAGNVYVTGQFMDTVDFDAGTGTTELISNGGYDVFVMKLNTNGDLQWVRNIGGLGTDVGKAIAVDDSGNVLVTGWVQQSGADFDPGSGVVTIASYGFNDVFVLKLNSSGNYVWAQRFGSISEDVGYAIATDADGNVYTAGTFTADAYLDPGPGGVIYPLYGTQDAFITKMDAGGTFVWGKAFNGLDDSRVFSIDLDAAGNIYATGYYDSPTDFDGDTSTFLLSPNGMYDAWISKMNGNGGLIWARDLGGSDYDHGWGVAVDNNGNVYSTGDYATDIDLDPGTGITGNLAVGGYDTYISMLDSSGNYIWGKTIGGTGTDRPGGIAVDDTGNIYVAGVYLATADFDPGSSVFNMTPVGSGDVFVEKLSHAPLGIQDATNTGLSIYPNPASGSINIYSSGKAVAAILDVKGVLVKSETLLGGLNTINLTSLSGGIYFLKVRTDKGISVQRFIKD